MSDTIFRDCVDSMQFAIDHFGDDLMPEEDEARAKLIDLACYLTRLESLGFLGDRVGEKVAAL